MLTIQQAIEILNNVPEEKRHLPLHVCDVGGNADNIVAKGITTYNRWEELSEDNPLAVDFDPDYIEGEPLGEAIFYGGASDQDKIVEAVSKSQDVMECHIIPGSLQDNMAICLNGNTPGYEGYKYAIMEERYLSPWTSELKIKLTNDDKSYNEFEEKFYNYLDDLEDSEE